MKPKLIALNLLLAVAIAAVIWGAVLHIQELNREHRLAPAPHPAAVQTAPIPRPDAPPATKYEDVAKKNLFSADRNDDIVIDAPKPEDVKPMPPLPVVFGVMSLPSGVKASMAAKSGDASRMVKNGDTVGEFKIVALDPKDVTFDWNGKQISKHIEDLIDRSSREVASNAPAAAAPPPPPPQAAAPKKPSEASLGKEIDSSSRACVAGDSSAIGAVVNGYRKDGQQTPFGTMNCRWVKQ
ncbi:MAG: hypothetical protein KGN84_14035 [Acidobacteriota bacterium]|nr:hypothetical protein [Acidobacteriota bacterium]